VLCQFSHIPNVINKVVNLRTLCITSCLDSYLFWIKSTQVALNYVSYIAFQQILAYLKEKSLLYFLFQKQNFRLFES